MKCVGYCGRIFAQCFVILSVSEVSKRWCALGLRGGGFGWVGVLFGLAFCLGLDCLVGYFGLRPQYDRIGELE